MMVTFGVSAARVRDSFRGCGPFFNFHEQSLLQVRVIFCLVFLISASFLRSTPSVRVH